MISKVFNDCLNRLIANFGPNAFTSERIRRMELIFHDVPDAGMLEITEQILDGSRYAPLPKELIELKRSWEKSNLNQVAEGPKPFIIFCYDCYDIGYCRLKSELNISAWAICKCVSGKAEFMRDRWKLPMCPVGGFKINPFPLASFKPSLPEGPDDKTIYKNIWEKKYAWEDSMRESEMFWVSFKT